MYRIAHLHDDVTQALHAGICSQTPGTLPGDLKTMAANKAFKDVKRSKNKTLPTILTEDDVPGASLKGRKPEQLKNDELKRWLRCRGTSVSGTCMQLLES